MRDEGNNDITEKNENKSHVTVLVSKFTQNRARMELVTMFINTTNRKTSTSWHKKWRIVEGENDRKAEY